MSNNPGGKKGSKIWTILLIIAIVAGYMHFTGKGVDDVPVLGGILGGKDPAESNQILRGIDQLTDNDDYKYVDRENRGQAVEDYLKEAALDGDKDSNGNTIVQDSVVRDKGNGVCIYTDSGGGLNVVQYDNSEDYTLGEFNPKGLSDSPKGSGSSDNPGSTDNSEAPDSQHLQTLAQTDGIVLFGLDEPGSKLDKNCQKIADSLCSQGSECNLDHDVTVSEYGEKLSGYDYALIETHGSMLNYGYGFVNESSNIVPVLCTRDDVTSDNLEEYAEDISEQRIAKVYTIDSADTKKKYYRYWIMPSFFTEHYGNNELNDTYIHLGCCYSYGGNIDNHDGEDLALSDALTSCGAAAVTGYYNSVFTYYDYGMISEIMKHLFQGSTLSASADAARKVYGRDDEEFAMLQGWYSPDNPHQEKAMDKLSEGIAYLIISGDSKLRLGDGSIKATQEDTQAETRAETEAKPSASVAGYWVDIEKREQLGDQLLWDDCLNIQDDGTGYLAISGGATRFTYTLGDNDVINFTDETGVRFTGMPGGGKIVLSGPDSFIGNGRVFTYEGPPRD